MGLKSIELQVAIPRSQDAGKMQEQAMRQGQQFQDTLTQQQLREQIVKRKKVNELDDVHHKKVTDEDQDGSNHKEEKEHNSRKKQKNDTTNHPYLGTKVDFSG